MLLAHVTCCIKTDRLYPKFRLSLTTTPPLVDRIIELELKLHSLDLPDAVLLEYIASFVFFPVLRGSGSVL